MRVVELFAGAGGMSLGLRRAGFEIVAAYDSWNVAVDTYRRNVGIHIKQIDLKDIFAAGPELASIEPDMIVGGPPCQDFSAAGMRSEGERAAMTRAFAMLVCIAKARMVSDGKRTIGTKVTMLDGRTRNAGACRVWPDGNQG